MELALITAKQVIVLFFLILTGIVVVKTGILQLENKKILSNLLIQLVVPAMVLNSYMMEFDPGYFRRRGTDVCQCICHGV